MAGGRTRVFVLFVLMVVLAVAVAAVSITALYKAGFEQQKGRLFEIAQSQARLIEAVARFDQQESADFPGGGRAATISQVIDSHRSYKAFGETGELLFAEHKADQVVFIMSHRGYKLLKPGSVTIGSERAVPMQKAVAGESGIIVDTDYRGNRVLAAYSPVHELDLGIVVKMDISEIRAPYIRASVISCLVGMVLIAVGTLLFLRVSTPIITDLQKNNAELRHMLELQETIEAISRHDLKGPLGVLMGLPELLLERDYLQEEDRHLLQTISMGASRMLSIIDRSLSLVKMEKGIYEPQIEVLDMVALLYDVITEYQHVANNKAVKIDLRIDKAPPKAGETLSVATDRAIIRMLVSHLTLNAVEAAPESSCVCIRLHTEERSAGLTLDISNDGEVPAGIRERFFEKYVTSGKKDGTGLGTYTAKLCAETLGGEIKMHTSAAQGTVVTTSLPDNTMS